MSSRPSTLVVEDNQEFAEELTAALQDRGLQCDLATEWTEALELFRINGYPLVIADYNLPHTQHGLQLLARMKVLLPSSRLILMSGALTPAAERSLADITLIDAYYSKADPQLIPALADHIDRSELEGQTATDWRTFAGGYVADLERDYPEIARIDELLRTDVERGSA